MGEKGVFNFVIWKAKRIKLTLRIEVLDCEIASLVEQRDNFERFDLIIAKSQLANRKLIKLSHIVVAFFDQFDQE